jgi:hypothetical protein
MSARRPCVTLIGAVVIFSTIAPVSTFAEVEKTDWAVQELYRQCTARKGSLDEIFCLEFVSAVARRVFTNGLALKANKDPPDLTTMSIPSACPKSFVSNEVMVAAFNEWVNQHIEKWGVSAQKGVMQAMGDTWPCF